MIALIFAASLVVTDGDTFRLDGEAIRIAGIDAPEIRGARCDEELARGVKARVRLRQLLAAGPPTIERRGKDKYGRTLARVVVAGRDVGQVLIAEKLAVPWAGRRHRWCDAER